ncbi:IS1595 family transposase [Sulfurirhabdus autotrophica]|uniref:Transposase-like zinc ribbon protein n=1 Tax=Sulfurirhabdus autotrophica TaxID=1706046 RepID=A0A4R3XPI4_9PROT|nr:IS1595 family transposase [Sulfurirhabdus autotrophica]TCV77375.1 transposase-like zinc ribbon protein [Sulfurirhabdus autotrophica]
MAMNRLQLQPGLSMMEFMNKYGTESLCQNALEQARWPEGFRCTSCRDERHSVFHRKGHKYFQCHRCRHQTTVISGTIFQATKISLTRWFLAMHLLTQAKNNVSALELKRHLGVSYPTAWLMKHKLMKVMSLREDRRVLEGRVEIDDAYLGGERAGKTGRGSENKVPLIAAVQTSDEGRPLYVRLNRIAAFTKEAVDEWANKALSASARTVSDGLHCFRTLSGSVAEHQSITVGGGRQSVKRPEFRWVNTLLGNLKTAISGTYHAFNFFKYADRYLAEAQYRFNRRFDLSTILTRLLRASAVTRPHPLCRIRLAEDAL